MLFKSVFIKMHKKVINCLKRPKLRFYKCVFKITEKKNICASIVFKAESNTKKY